MGKTPVHQVTLSRKEIREAQAKASRSGALAAPMSEEELRAYHAKQNAEIKRLLDGQAPKARRERKDTEHRAQRRLYQELLPAAETRYPPIAHMLRAVYAIPNFNVSLKGPKAAIIGARFKAEGQKAGSPDNHVPVPRTIGGTTYGSLFLELKAESYPNDAQRERFPQLAACGNAVVTIREPDEIKLADKALSCIVTYLLGGAGFFLFGHPKFTYVHNTTHPLAEIGL